MRTKLIILVCTVALLLVATASACAAGADEASQIWSRQTGDMEVVEETAALRAAPAPAPTMAPAAPAAPATPGLPGNPGEAVAVVVKEVAVEKEVLKEVKTRRSHERCGIGRRYSDTGAGSARNPASHHHSNGQHGHRG